MRPSFSAKVHKEETVPRRTSSPSLREGEAVAAGSHHRFAESDSKDPRTNQQTIQETSRFRSRRELRFVRVSQAAGHLPSVFIAARIFWQFLQRVRHRVSFHRTYYKLHVLPLPVLSQIIPSKILQAPTGATYSDDVASLELGENCWFTFYKDFAPTAMVVSPHLSKLGIGNSSRRAVDETPSGFDSF